MARTKSSENENSGDEVILRVKKKSVPMKLDSGGDDPLRPLGKNVYLVKSYSCIEKRSGVDQEKFLNENQAKKLFEFRSMLQNGNIEAWHDSENHSVISPEVESNSGAISNEKEGRQQKSISAFIKRDSSLRQSFNNFLRRGFSRESTKSFSSSSSNSSSDKSRPRGFVLNRLSNSCNIKESEEESGRNEQFNSLVKVKDFRVLSFVRTISVSSSTSSNRSTNSVSFGIRSAPSSPMAPLQGQSEVHGQSVINLNTITRSPSHHPTSKLDSKSLRQISPSIPVAASTARSISPHPKSSSSSTSKNEVPEKEKKRKELSSSRQKKFHRHFQQVSKDERVLNYFSCALVSDILLQGHLYITENYFAFYSNVFGFVTKLLIPTASVIKISKEKTAKIIPNAVGVATADERHVFGSFMSREAAFRLMCSVCPPLEPIENIPKVPDVEVSEEYSVEDDSSCSISGNESPPQLLDSTSDASQSIRQRTLPPIAPTSVDVVDGKSTIDIPEKAKILSTPCSTSTPVKQSKSPPPRIVSSSRTIKIRFPTDFHIVYLGVVLSVVLALFSGFLLYRILDIEAKTRYKSSLDFKWGSGNDVDVYAEALKWQKEMQTKSTEEAQIILNTNLEQIAKVRKSLETLSLLIHDKNTLSSDFESAGNEKRKYDNEANSAIEQGETT